MTQIKVGDKIKDNDPRMKGRVLTVVAILPFGVLAKNDQGREFIHSDHRIHTDGKPRKSGMSLVGSTESAP